MALDEMSGVQSKLQQNNLELKKKYVHERPAESNSYVLADKQQAAKRQENEHNTVLNNN